MARPAQASLNWEKNMSSLVVSPLANPEDEAKTLAVSTVFGGADMVGHSEDTPIEELIAKVCSKGGTTIQAVESFKSDDLYGAIDRAVDACVRRAEELSK